MICAMTARRITDGRVDEFIEKFGEGPENIPEEIAAKFKGVYACQDAEDPNVILTFGMFDGSLEEFRELQSGGERAQQLDQIAPLVEEVLIDSSFEVIRDLSPAMSPAR